MGTFGDQIRQQQLALETRNRAIFANIASAVQASIQFGSPVTGSLGQPVDLGYLRASWTLTFGEAPQFTLNGLGAAHDPAWGGGAVGASAASATSSTVAWIATNCVYALAIEDGVRAVGRGNVTGHTKQRLAFRSQVGGAHSYALTIAGFDRIVADEEAQFGGSR